MGGDRHLTPLPKRPIYRRLFADLRPLQESPEYRRLWIGGMLSSTGGQMTSVAVPVQIYALTHSSLAVGMLGLALAVPLITLGLLGGTFVDAVDRRILVLITSSLLAVASLLFAAQAFLDLRQLWLLYGLAAVQSALVGIDSPARRTFIPRLLPPDRIPAAAALSFLSFQASLIVGPLLAGTLIVAAGFQSVYLIDALTFLFSLYALLRLRPMPPTGEGTRAGLRAVIEGFRFMRRRSILLTVLFADLNATIFGMPFALFPALAATRFGGGPRTVGLLYAALATGGLISSVFSGPLTHLRRQGLAVLLSTGLWGIAIAGFGLTRTVWAAAMLIAVAGVADVITGVFRTTILQVNTPDAFQGRVNGVGFVVGSGGPRLGDVESGVVAALTSPVISAVSGGIVCVLGAGLLAVAFPALARYDAVAAVKVGDDAPSLAGGSP